MAKFKAPPTFKPYFSIKSSDPDISFLCAFGDGPPTVIDGYAGWEVTSRPREVGIVQWSGRNPMAIEIPFLIDNSFDDPDNMPGIETEDSVRALEKLAGIGGHAEPPICTVDGKGAIPHDRTNAPTSNHKWVVENIAWDKELEVRSPSSRRRLRCGGTITIRQYLTAVVLAAIPTSHIHHKKKKPHHHNRKKKHKVKARESLHTISNLYYGDPGKWTDIADVNNKRDPMSVTVGEELDIP